MVAHPQKFPHGRPKTYVVSSKNVLSLPFRLCNPPPSVGKVRSLSVVPLYKVRLDDVLNRKHLPPLGLKDFEEWLLFVEMSPENLYFVLWLREYKRRYRQWKSQNEFKKTSSDPRNWAGYQNSTHLAMFYSRAKQTFFTPGSEYELNLPSTLLSPFHADDASPHPDPQKFVDIELETRRMLQESLRRFVQGQLSNMGNNRIICGIIVGCLICIIGATPPLAANFVLGLDRWQRLAALPGLWFGLWLITASLNGVCLGIYLFGDLRQLRQFELSRPPISKPVPLPATRPSRSLLSSLSSDVTSVRPRTSKQSTMVGELERIASDSSLGTRDTARTPTQQSSFDGNIQISQAYYDADEIDECAVMYDNATYDTQGKDHIPGWAREDEDHSPYALRSIFNHDNNGHANNGSQSDESLYTATATFIYPFDANDEHEQESLDYPQRHQRVDNFDFDYLPKRIRRRGQSRDRIAALEESVSLPSPPVVAPKITTISISPAVASDRSYSTIPSSPSTVVTPISPTAGLTFPPQMKVRGLDPRDAPPTVPATSFIGRLQEKCSMKRHRLQPGYLESDNLYSDNDPNKPHSSSAYWSSTSSPPQSPRRWDAKDRGPVDKSLGGSLNQPSGVTTNESRKKVDEADPSAKEEKVKLRLKKINAVPPFKAPLTKILSPIIQRGQWEIVIRSAIIGFLFAWIIVGSLLAVPVLR